MHSTMENTNAHLLQLESGHSMPLSAKNNIPTRETKAGANTLLSINGLVNDTDGNKKGKSIMDPEGKQDVSCTNKMDVFRIIADNSLILKREFEIVLEGMVLDRSKKRVRRWLNKRHEPVPGALHILKKIDPQRPRFHDPKMAKIRKWKGKQLPDHMELIIISSDSE